MNTTNTPAPHKDWKPHVLVSVDCTTTPRSAFIGRASALILNGIECVVMAKNDADIGNVISALTDGQFDPALVQRTTLIRSSGIEVVVPQKAEEVQSPVPPIVPETPAAPSKPGAVVPKRGDDNLPVAQYKKATAGAETAPVASDHGVFDGQQGDLSAPAGDKVDPEDDEL